MNAATPTGSFDCTENKRGGPCQVFCRNVTAPFSAYDNCQEKRFFESVNQSSHACNPRDSLSTFQPLPAHVARVIISADRSSEYRSFNRPQQSPHRNPFFRCAPFNCDYTQP